MVEMIALFGGMYIPVLTTLSCITSFPSPLKLLKASSKYISHPFQTWTVITSSSGKSMASDGSSSTGWATSKSASAYPLIAFWGMYQCWVKHVYVANRLLEVDLFKCIWDDSIPRSTSCGNVEGTGATLYINISSKHTFTMTLYLSYESTRVRLS